MIISFASVTSMPTMIIKITAIAKNISQPTVIIRFITNKISNSFNTMDDQAIKFVNKHGLSILRISLSLVFLWFGLLKAIGESPVTPLVENMFPGISTELFVLVLGITEIGIGIALALKILLRIVIAIMTIHLVSTFSLLITLNEIMTNNNNPFLLTLEGEFIIKNLVLIAGALTVASTIRIRNYFKKNDLCTY